MAGRIWNADPLVVWREHSAAGFEDHPVDCRHCWELANPAGGDFLAWDGLEAVDGQEVPQGWVGQLPAVAAVDRVVLEPGGRVLAPHHQLVVRVVEGVGAQPAQHRLLQLRARRPDGQHHRRLLLAASQGDDLVHLLVDAAGFVDQGEGVVQAF